MIVEKDLRGESSMMIAEEGPREEIIEKGRMIEGKEDTKGVNPPIDSRVLCSLLLQM